MSTTITSKIRGAIITEAGNGYPSEGAIVEVDGDAWRIVRIASTIHTLPRGNSVLAALEPAQWGDEDPNELRVEMLPALRLDLETQRTAEQVSDSAEWAIDVASVAAGITTIGALREHCLKGVDDEADGEVWRDYVARVADAAGVECGVSDDVELVSIDGTTDDLAAYATVRVQIDGAWHQVGCMLGAPESDRATHRTAGGMPDGSADAWWTDPSDWASVGAEHRDAALDALRSAAPKLWREARDRDGAAS